MRTVFFYLISISCLLCLRIQSRAQNGYGTLSGKVSTESGEELVGATVRITGTQFGTTADTEGRYTIARIPAGSYTVMVSQVGFDSREQHIVIPAGQSAKIDFILVEGMTTLNAIEITGKSEAQE